MQVLFSMRHLGSFRMYESVLRRLAANGHEIRILANRRDSLGWGDTPTALLPDVPQIQWSWEEAHPTVWLEFATAVRIWQDYLRYFEPAYTGTPRLRTRAAERVPSVLRRITDACGRAPVARRAIARVLRTIERALPYQQAYDALVRLHRPDLVMLTPLLHLGSPQVELLRSARAQGVKSALCVGSWDHLSSKSLIREMPDRVLVWNETQKREAVELHGVPAEHVRVTGAQCYDHWFGRTPAHTREAFCARVQLPPDRPFVLWVSSALFAGSPSEARFVRRWIDALRASPDPVLSTAGILVRPHPARLDEWRDVDVSDLQAVTVFGSMPIDAGAKEDYFESLHYSAAVVGLNTSAFLEAAIVGRPVHTILLPEFSENQEGTLHFPYLLSVGGGLLRVAHDCDAHGLQLADSLREPERVDRNAAFVQAFIRPVGLDRPATDVFVDEVETFGRAPAPDPIRSPQWAPALRLLLWPFALATSVLVARGEPGDRTLRELQRARRQEGHRLTREAEAQQRRAAREAARLDKAQRAEAARREERRARQGRLDASDREKRDRRRLKEREKLQRTRAKRRGAILSQIRRRLGLGRAAAPPADSA